MQDKKTIYERFDKLRQADKSDWSEGRKNYNEGFANALAWVLEIYEGLCATRGGERST